MQTRALVRTDFAALTEEEAERRILELVKERTVGGKVKIVGKGGQPELVDLEPGDLDAMPAVMIDRIYAEMAGLTYDADPLDKTPTVSTSSETEATDQGTEDTPSKQQTASTRPTETA